MQTTHRPIVAVVGLALTAALAAGCAGTDDGGAMPATESTPSPRTGAPSTSATPPADATTPPLSSTDLPTMTRPPEPPKTPSDLVPRDVVAGRVTRGGSGPCYGLVTEDGTEYAVHSTAGTALTEGTYVRVRFEPAADRTDCGRGIPVTALEVTILD